MNERDKAISNGFAQLLLLMIEENDHNATLTFEFANCKAKFNVDLIELIELKEKGE